MELACVSCGEVARVGVLCTECAARLTGPARLFPDHVVSGGAEEPSAWLIDRWGRPHPVTPEMVVGRQGEHQLRILDSSVSRQHARLDSDGDAWVVRDLGSRNGTYIDGQRVQGRGRAGDGARVQFGHVSFLIKAAAGIEPPALHAATTGGDSAAGTFRYLLSEQRGRELCLLGTRGAGEREVGGVLMFRDVDDDSWSERDLPPLEFQFLRALCERWLAESGSSSKSRGCVSSRSLASTLPFKSRYASAENVRQLVLRLRATLKEIEVEDLVVAVPGRGYHLTRQVYRG